MPNQCRCLAVIATLCLAAPLTAQGATQSAQGVVQDVPRSDTMAVRAPASAPQSSVARASAAGPVRPQAILAPREHDPAPTPAFVPPEHTRHATAMMIVGGAGLIVGAIIGGQPGTVVMVGGGVVGLIGLWHYLR